MTPENSRLHATLDSLQSEMATTKHVVDHLEDKLVKTIMSQVWMLGKMLMTNNQMDKQGADIQEHDDLIKQSNRTNNNTEDSQSLSKTVGLIDSKTEQIKIKTDRHEIEIGELDINMNRLNKLIQDLTKTSIQNTIRIEKIEQNQLQAKKNENKEEKWEVKQRDWEVLEDKVDNLQTEIDDIKNPNDYGEYDIY